MLEKKMKKPACVAAAVIFLCFLISSTGWLAWNCHVREYMPQRTANVVTMVAGYLLQAAGVGLFALILRYKPYRADMSLPVFCLFHMLFMVPALIRTDLLGIASGFVTQVFCGSIAGYYLYYFVRCVPLSSRAKVFGTAYGLSVLMSWLFSLMGGNSFYQLKNVLAVCAVLTVIVIFIVRRYPAEKDGAACGSGHSIYGSSDDGGENESPAMTGIILRGILILLLGLGIGCGFTFSPSDIGETVNVELSRLVYALSLMAAGAVTDRSRRSGAVCALTALVFPFVMLSLRGEAVPAAVFWMLSYFAFGFYSVYRIVLFSDLNILYLSGFGLMIGRVADALAEAVSLALYDYPVIHVGFAAVLCVAAIFVFFRMYNFLYVPSSEPADGAVIGTDRIQAVAVPAEEAGAVIPAAKPDAGDAMQKSRTPVVNEEIKTSFSGVESARSLPEAENDMLRSGEDRFYRFAARYELSPRERDILRLILEEKKNCEIADALYISENTVKFHVRNILKKTGCRNRNELVLDYAGNM